MRASTTSTNPLQHAVTRPCRAIWDRIRSDPMSSSADLAYPWQLASKRASSQAGWDAPALSKISKISKCPSLTAAVVEKPLKSFWFTSAPILCHCEKYQTSSCYAMATKILWPNNYSFFAFSMLKSNPCLRRKNHWYYLPSILDSPWMHVAWPQNNKNREQS